MAEPERAQHMPTLRVLRLLETVSNHSAGLTLTEIAAATGMPKSSLFPIVHTLEAEGYLACETAGGRYLLGMGALELGNRFLAQFDMMDYVKHQMDSIVDICNETCHFALLSGGDILYLHKVDSREPIRMVSSIGLRLPAYSTALGKALLCGHSMAELQRLYPDGLRPLTEHTITDMESLAAQLEEVRRDGAAYEREESNAHIQCVAVPLYRNGRPQMALSVAVPVFRAEAGHLELIEGLLRRARKNIEQMLLVTEAGPEGLG